MGRHESIPHRTWISPRPDFRRRPAAPGRIRHRPSQADTRTRLTREIGLNIPVISSAMDTVTEADMAIVMAQMGGIGVLHRNLSIEEQCAAVRAVKRFESGMVVNPITIAPDATLGEAQALMQRNRISGIPVVEAGRQAGRHPDQPRRALCRQPGPAGARTDDAREPRHGPRRRPGRSAPPAAPAPDRKAAGGGRCLPLHRPDHGQGHRKGGDLSPTPPRTRPAACAWPPRPRWATRASSAPRRCSRPNAMSSSSIPRMATIAMSPARSSG
jgi:hypothetical protein